MTFNNPSLLLTAPDLIADEKKSISSVRNAFFDIVRIHFTLNPTGDASHIIRSHRNLGVRFNLDSEQFPFVLGLAIDHLFSAPAAGEPMPEDFGLSAMSIDDYRRKLRDRFQHPFRTLSRWLSTGMGLLDSNRKELKRFEHALFDYAKACFHYRTTDRVRRYDFWYSLDGRNFEIEFANLLRRIGFDVETTPASADGGVDIWLYRPEGHIAIQCKKHHKPVGVAVVREMYGVMKSRDVSRGMIVSISGFTSGASEFAENKNISLLQVDDIIHLATRALEVA